MVDIVRSTLGTTQDVSPNLFKHSSQAKGEIKAEIISRYANEDFATKRDPFHQCSQMLGNIHQTFVAFQLLLLNRTYNTLLQTEQWHSFKVLEKHVLHFLCTGIKMKFLTMYISFSYFSVNSRKGTLESVSERTASSWVTRRGNSSVTLLSHFRLSNSQAYPCWAKQSHHILLFMH